jgi:glycosyltransferase involved in cell wall biosynthesis
MEVKIMKKADLHVHSKFSGTSSMFFLQKNQINESYTEPEFIYRTAKKMGMDFVTITDHNSIEGIKRLIQKHPEDTFMGVELTANFPEDKTEIHILVYDFSESQFEILNQKRGNIYELRDYILHENLPHAVAHATYAVNQQLTIEHLEKLILLFDSFETINGCRSSASNTTWRNSLEQLDEKILENLALKHRMPLIYPITCKKGYTGGSDDHSGLWIGHTFTLCQGDHLGSFLAGLRNRTSEAMGSNGNYRYMAANFLKITHHCLQHKQPKYSRKLGGKIADSVFNLQELSIWSKSKLHLMYWFSLLKRKEFIPSILKALIHLLSHGGTMDDRINGLYKAMAQVVDEMVVQAVSSLSDDFKQGRLRSIISKSMIVFEALLAVSPFMVTLREQNQQKNILTQLKERFPNQRRFSEKRILWFTDTFTDLNGVSATLSDIFSISQRDRLPVKFVVSESLNEINLEKSKDLLNLSSIYEIPLPFYEHYQLKLPSLLNAMQRISEEEPSHIYISTLGPLGMLGLLMANLLHVPVTGIYHSDHSKQVKNLTNESFVHQSMKWYEQWFYGQMDKVIVHSMAYKEELMAMGIDENKIHWRPKGIDTSTFHFLPSQNHLSNNLVMLYTGRISQDKNIEFLLKIYHQAKSRNPHLELWMAGDGPLLKNLDKIYLSDPSIRWFGRLERSKLVALYQQADLFVFPSNTDTFGMSVLEAQLCGLPAIVSMKGGPKEIIQDHETGLVCSTDNPQAWLDAISYFSKEKEQEPEHWKQRKTKSRAYAIKNRDWKYVLPELLELKEATSYSPYASEIALTV